MRFNVTLAICLSVVLVGFASWQRFSTSSKPLPTLVAAENTSAGNQDVADTQAAYQQLLETASTNPPTASTPKKPLSNSDLIGRGLINDYLALLQSGKEIDNNALNNLAQKYVADIPSLTQAKTVTSIRTAPDKAENFQIYADAISKIYNSYSSKINAIPVNKSDLDSLNPRAYSYLTAFSDAYRDAASALENVPVPETLAQTHLALINTYLSSAEAAKEISQADADSAAAFSGLVVFNNNLEREDALLAKISGVLTSHGL